ncbi:MAG: cytochrome P450 [Halieaceae bacterium]|nr:cytochrome P450 [Halieaceae bacterium]
MSANIQTTHDIDFTRLAIQGDRILEEINQVREHDPIYWSENSQCWLVTGHNEVMEGFSGELPLSSTHLPESLYRVMPPEDLNKCIPMALKYMTQVITNQNGEKHARLRKLIVKAFSAKLVKGLKPFVQERVSQLMDTIDNEREFEFNETIARQLPGSVILHLLGMDQSHLSRLKCWADGVTQALTTLNPTPEWLGQLEVVVKDMVSTFSEEIEDRKQNPGTDLISYLLAAREDKDSLSNDEMIGALIMVIVAGHDTTSNSMTLGARVLANHPEIWQTWRSHPESSVDYAIELMRYMAMSTSIPRIASEDFQWRNKTIKNGQLVMLVIAGGNRDPKVFSQPNVIDLGRKNGESLTFGPGLHHCIGHLLAKLQLSEFFTALIQRFDRIEIVEEPEFNASPIFRNVVGLQTRFYPSSGN